MGLLDDLARQGANVTHGIGRRDAQTALPTPSEVYASELLDRNTCDPCGDVDGRTYATLDDGLEDYPGAGGYIGCEGGSRCRGTLVLVHNPEAPPTQNTPGDGTPAPHPPDRTPQGPTGVPRPAHIDDVGDVIPTPPGGVPADTGTLDLAPDGTTIPPEALEETIDTVAPSEVGRDPELAELEDHHLEQILDDDAEPLERRMAAADEIDQRAAGTRTQVWVEEELDAATLAQYEIDRAAWEQAGGYAAEAVAQEAAVRAGGRRIDQLRHVWANEVELIAIRAEEATRGALLRKDRAAEFITKYGADSSALFEGPARQAYYYASRELRDFWEEAGGRLTFDEFAVANGITDVKTTTRAAKAAAARNDAIRRAEETVEGKARRRAEQARKRRRTLTPGERLARDQARIARARASEARVIENVDDVVTAPPPPPPPAPPMGHVTPVPEGLRTTPLKGPSPGRPMDLDEWDEAPYTPADQDLRAIADPDDRATAVLQFDTQLGDAAKAVTRNLDEGRAAMHGIDPDTLPQSLITDDYAVADLAADVEGAGTRLHQWATEQTTDLNVPVYKGIQFPHGMTETDLRDALNVNLSYSSTTAGTAAQVDRVVAYYHGRPRYVTAVVVKIENARGLWLDSVGNHAINAEALVSGSLDIVAITQDAEGIWRVTARMTE